MNAELRPFGVREEAHQLELVPGAPDGIEQWHVPGFGVLMLAPAEPERGAILVQPQFDGTYGEASNIVHRDVDVVDGEVHVELLPCSAGEPRLLVVVTPERG